MSAEHHVEGVVGNLESDVKRAGKKAAYNPVMEALTRIGYGVRGLIYIMMGLLAFSVALGKGGTPINQQGAIELIGRQPAGMVLLWVVLIGLVSYALWGVIRAVLDPLQKGHDLKGLAVRGGYLLSAVSYAALVVPTYGFIKGSGNTNQSGAQSQDSMASLMAVPLGRLAIGLAGLAVIAVGVSQILAGFNAKFDQQFKSYTMNATEVKWATQLGRIGTATRGFIFVLLGGLISLAAIQFNPGQKIGIDSALSTLLRQPYGIWLLGIVALGLIAFGTYSIAGAVWFRLKRS